MKGSNKFKKRMVTMCSDYSEFLCDSTKIIAPSSDSEENKKRVKDSILESMKLLMQTMKRSFRILEEEKLVSQDILDNLDSRFKRKLASIEKEGESFEDRELLGLNAEDLKNVYGHALILFDKEETDKSSDLFQFLVNLLPTQSNFWLGLALSDEKRKDYVSAFHGFNMSASLGEENIQPFISASKCLIRLKKHPEADKYIRQIVRDIKKRENPKLYENIVKKLKKLRHKNKKYL
jgi:tetratricopeptide (TPR) repeat protein